MPDYSAFPITNGVRTFLAAPDGYDVDFSNPERNYALTLYLVIGIGNFITLLFMSQRLYTKAFLTKGLELDDGFLVLSWLCSLIVQGVTLWSVVIGARGVHAWEQPIERFVLFKISVYVGGAVFVPCASFAKVALLIFYLRLSPQKWFRYAVWATIGLIAAYSPAIVLALLFACKPVDATWTFAAEGECIDTTALFIATCVMNSLTDVILFLLPIPTVLRLKMPLIQRLGAIATFSVGLVTIITSVVRAAILPQLSGADQSWVTAQASVWSQLECNLIVICGTVPTLRKFVRHFSPRLLGSSSATQERTTPNVTRSNTHAYARSGSRRRNPYAQFEEHDDTASNFEMALWDGRVGTTNKGEGPAAFVVSGNSSNRKSEDETSEKAIIATREVIVERD